MVVIFLVAGALGGWFWHHLWAPAPEGFVYAKIPRFDDDQEFRGTGLYLMISVATGLVIAAVCTAVFERNELWTLAAVIVGAFAAGFVMQAVGHALGPDSASAFAEQAKDYERVRADLHAAWLPVIVGFPAGALLGSVSVLSLPTGRKPEEPTG